MAPLGTGPSDPNLGRFKNGIHSKFSVEEHAFVGSIEVAPPIRDGQVKAIFIEFGRQNKGGGGRQPRSGAFRNTGTTDPVTVISRTQSIIGPNVGRLRRAMDRAVKKVGLKN